MNERSLFLEALDLAPADRPAFLDRACDCDDALRQRVEALLLADDGSSRFMSGPATATYVPVSESPGTRIGPYKLLQQIGEGGMGVVFMAEQDEPVRRRVALKIIKPGMDSKQVVARFEAERQALSMMDHPNIAKVLDAGTTASGRPFFVMELVHGVPIVEFCDANKYGTRQRLALFVSVCQAIQHAHMKGIIHRDVKPSNVLVTMYDDKPVAKVIDFGVAKAVEQRLTERTMFTQYGALIGTFEYMSPEQAEMNALGVDTRSDVYSLGVLLYELLTGTTPLDRQRLRSAALGEVIRLIKEEEPPRPSLRLSSSGLLPKLAALRRTEPGKLSASLRGELDWIVMRCLEKDRTRRYETAVGLARDVERHLNGDAVDACPPTLGYRMRKVYRRNKAAVLVSMAFVGLVAASAVATAVLAVQATRAERAAVVERQRAEQGEAEAKDQRDRAEREQKRAEEEKRAAEAVRTFLQDDLLRQADVIAQADRMPLAGGEFDIKPNPTVRDLLDRAAAELTPERIERKFPGMPFVQAEVLHAVAAAYSSVVEVERGRPLIDRAVPLYRAARGDDHPATLKARKTQLLLSIALPPDQYDALLTSFVADATRVFGPRDRLVLEARLELARRPIVRNRNRAVEALPALEALQSELTALFGRADHLTLICGATIAEAYTADRRFLEAVKVMEGLREDVKGIAIRFDHPLLEAGLVQLGEIYREKGEIKKTIEVYEEILDAWKVRGQTYHPNTWRTRHLLAWVYARNGNLPKGAELFEANIPAAPTAFNAYLSLAALCEAEAKLGRDDKALVGRARQALAAAIGNRGMDYKSWVTGHARIRLGQLLLKSKDHAEAEAMLTAGLREMVDEYPHVRDYSLNAIPEGLRSLLALYQASNRAAEGVTALSELWTALEKHGRAAAQSAWTLRHRLAWEVISDHPDLAAKLFELNVRTAIGSEQKSRALHGLQDAEIVLGKLDAALAHARQALEELLNERPNRRDYDTGKKRVLVGNVLYRMKNYTEAELFLEAGCREIADHVSQVPEYEYPYIALPFEQLVGVHREAGRTDRAAEWLAVKKSTVDELVRRSLTANQINPSTVKLLESVILQHVAAGRHDEALATYRETEASHPPTVAAATDWAGLSGRVIEVYEGLLQPDRIKPWAELRLPALERELNALRPSKPTEPALLRATNALAVGYIDAGRKPDAVKLVEEIIVRFQLSGGDADLDSVDAFARLARTVATAGRADRGVTLTSMVHAVVTKANAPPGLLAAATFHIGHAKSIAGAHAEAEAHFREAVRLQTGADAKHGSLAKYQMWLGFSLCDQKKHDAAETILTAAHAACVARLADAAADEKGNPKLIAGRLAELYAITNRPDEAAKWKARSAAK